MTIWRVWKKKTWIGSLLEAYKYFIPICGQDSVGPLSSFLFFNFFIFCYSLSNFCVTISIHEIHTLCVISILPQLIRQYVIRHYRHLSFMSIYDKWQMSTGRCERTWQYECHKKRLNISNTYFVTEIMSAFQKI